MPLKVNVNDRLTESINTSVTFANTASSTATVTHGLSATPDWIAWRTDDNTPVISLATTNSTSLIFTRTATTTSGTARVDVFAGIQS